MSEHSIGLLLGHSKPLRLQVLSATQDWLAFNKPAHVAIDLHPFYPNTPTIISALQGSHALGKQELKRYTIQDLQHIYLIDPDISGIALISLNKKTTERLRNLFGSNQFQFTLLLLAIDVTPEASHTRSCNFPLASSHQKRQMIISHKHGKQSQTTFQHLETLERYSLWSANTFYPRIDQIRIHAKAVGLHIPGEQKYSQENYIFLSHLKQGNYKHSKSVHAVAEKPLYDALSLHLYQLTWKEETATHTITAPLPPKFQVLLKKLGSTYLGQSSKTGFIL